MNNSGRSNETTSIGSAKEQVALLGRDQSAQSRLNEVLVHCFVFFGDESTAGYRTYFENTEFLRSAASILTFGTPATYDITNKVTESLLRPTLRIRHRVPEHLQKRRPNQLIRQFDGFLPLAAHSVGLVQNGGNPLLLGEGGGGGLAAPATASC